MNQRNVALITGITGQDGSYLAELLLDKGYEVHGIKRRSSSFNTGRLNHLYFNEKVNFSSRIFLHFGDMTDMSSILRILSEVKPTEIYNLAAQSHVQVSFETPEYTSASDGLAVLKLLEAIRILKIEHSTRFYQASTSEMYGNTEEIILNEKSKFNPKSPYAVAKLFAHHTTINYREAYKIFASTGILFNHESPRRGSTFVTQKIIKAAVAISRNQKEKLSLGNLDSIRDWGHAKDYVDGMYKILQYHQPDDWVLATGETCSVREFVEKVFAYLSIELEWVGKESNEKAIAILAGIKKTIIDIDPRLKRPIDVPYLRGDFSKANKLLGWKPTYNLDSLIREMIESELSNHNQ